jgi:tripartite motif-containing protein 71
LRKSRLVLGLFVVLSVLVPTVPASAAVTLTPVRTIGGPGHAELYGWGMETARDGSILVGDYWNFRIARYAPNGTSLGDVVTTANQGLNAGQHQSPYGIAVDPRNGDIWFGDVDQNKTVDKYSATGSFIREIGGAGQGTNKYQYPSYVSVNSAGRLFVSDQWEHNIVGVDPDGTERFQVGTNGTGPGQFRQPRGQDICDEAVCGVRQDYLYVIDNYNARVQVWDTKTTPATYVTSFGSRGSGLGQFGSNPDLRGLAIDDDRGWVYVVDASTALVNKYDLAGTPLASWGGFGSGPGKFPGGGRDVTVDGEGNVWVGDMPGFRAQVFDADGTFKFQVPGAPSDPPQGGFNQPRGVTVDSDGNVYVTDTHNWRVEKFSPTGDYITEWGHRGGGAFGFNYQRGISADLRDNSIVVADTDNHMIEKFTSTGAFVWSVGGFGTANGQFKNPHSLEVAPDGRIAVADTQNQRVVILSETGAFIRAFGTNGTGNGQFRFPRSVTWDADGSLWVSDSLRGDVQHFSDTGSFLGKITPTRSGSDILTRAADVVVDGANVYVADVDANRVKVWTKAGAFVGAFGGPGNGALLRPHGMDLVNGQLYVVEQTGEKVTVFQVSDGPPPPPDDTTPPTSTVSSPTANQVFSTVPVTFAGTATDNVAVKEVRISIQDTQTKLWWRSNGTWGQTQPQQATLASPNQPSTGWTFAFTPAPNGSGRYAVQVVAVDTSNNVATTKPFVQFRVSAGSTDTTPANGTVSTPTANQVLTATPVNMTGAATDDVGVAEVRISIQDRDSKLWLRSNGTWGPAQPQQATLASPGATSTGWTFAFTPPTGGSGRYAVQVAAVDAVGNVDPTKPWVQFSVT